MIDVQGYIAVTITAFCTELLCCSDWLEPSLHKQLAVVQGLEDDGQELMGLEAAGRPFSEAFSRTNFVPGTRPGGSLAARTPRGGKPGMPEPHQ